MGSGGGPIPAQLACACSDGSENSLPRDVPNLSAKTRHEKPPQGLKCAADAGESAVTGETRRFSQGSIFPCQTGRFFVPFR